MVSKPDDDDQRLALIDMDGTVCDYDAALTRDLEAMRDKDRENPPILHHGDNVPPHIEARVRFIRSQPGWWRNLDPLNLGKEIVDVLLGFDYKLHFLTKGPKEHPPAWQEKLEWCQEHYPDVDVTITRKKGLVYGKILVDDWPAYVESWLAHRPRGLVVMPAHHWNAGYEKTENRHIMRYHLGMQKQLIARLEEVFPQIKRL